MEVLPDAERQSFSERMRFAWLLATESFELDAPTPPESPSVAELQRWTDGELEAWLRQKNEMVEAARKELDDAAEESHSQRILAGALVGLMYEDVARVLLRVPVPDELERDPEIAQVYREIVEFQAKPYLQHARRAYRACSLNAVRPESMRAWSDFCGERRNHLPLLDEGGGQGNTVVTVQVE
jgi:hypothetical protein